MKARESKSTGEHKKDMDCNFPPSPLLPPADAVLQFAFLRRPARMLHKAAVLMEDAIYLVSVVLSVVEEGRKSDLKGEKRTLIERDDA